MEQRNCNALETIFAQANVTVGACVGFKTPLRVEDVKRAIRECLDINVCGCLEVVGVGTPVCKLRILRSSERNIRMVPYPVTADVAVVFQKLLATPDSFFPNRIDTVMIVEPDHGDCCHGVCFSGNHCLWDGKSIVQVVEGFLSLLSPKSKVGDITPPSKICYEWGQLLKDHAGAPCASPVFLPIRFEHSGGILTMKDIQLSFHEETSEQYGVCDVRMDFEPLLLKGILKLLRREQSGTLTSLLTVCLQQALGEVYLSSTSKRGSDGTRTSCNMTTRILVNLRQSLGTVTDKDRCVSQCFGHVVVGNTIQLLDGVGDSKTLLGLSKSTALDLKDRISRGEAIAASLVLSEGNFDDGQKDHATFELSNFGVYDVGEDIVVYHTQRFEGYDGVSVLAHSEKSTGVFRMACSLMGPINPELVAAVLQRTKDLFTLLVSTTE